MAKPHLRLVAPRTVNRTVIPKRVANRALRTREYLTPDEVGRLITAVKGNRWGRRDATMVLVAYRHGMRASELSGLKTADVDLESGSLDIRRLKGSLGASTRLKRSGSGGYDAYSGSFRTRRLEEGA